MDVRERDHLWACIRDGPRIRLYSTIALILQGFLHASDFFSPRLCIFRLFFSRAGVYFFSLVKALKAIPMFFGRRFLSMGTTIPLPLVPRPVPDCQLILPSISAPIEVRTTYLPEVGLLLRWERRGRFGSFLERARCCQRGAAAVVNAGAADGRQRTLELHASVCALNPKWIRLTKAMAIERER